MMKFTYMVTFISLTLVSLMLSACGGGDTTQSNSSSQTSTIVTKSLKSMVMENSSCVEGLNVKCDSAELLSQKDGSFACSDFPITVSLGSLEIGTLKSKTPDNFYYTQDILGVNRGAIAHAEVTKISMILQSLDEDALPLNGITLTRNTVELLNTIIMPNTKLKELSFEDVNYLIEDIIKLDREENKSSQLKAVSQEIAQSNLAKQICMEH